MAAARQPALISLLDRKYQGGDWMLSLKLPVYSPIVEHSTAPFCAACRTALSIPWAWLSLCRGKTREIYCSLLAAQSARITDPSKAWGRSRGCSQEPQGAASTPPSDRWQKHRALEEGGWHRTCPCSHQPPAFPWTPCGNLWARNGAGFAGLSDSGFLLPSEIPCTGGCVPSASLDHIFPATRDPHGLWKSKSNKPCCTTANAAPKTC